MRYSIIWPVKRAQKRFSDFQPVGLTFQALDIILSIGIY